MGDFNASDCSWKKMVIAKANNEWISTIKTEQCNDNITEDTTNFSLNDDEPPYKNIKQEFEDDNSSKPFVSIPVIIPHVTIEESDPLFLDVSAKRRRRKGSGPKFESPEERAVRLAKMSAYAAQRLANESPDQRALRLKRMSEYAAKRLARETNEQRAKRLARMSEYAAKRLAKETPEQRQARLARMSAYAARRQAMKKIMSPGTSDSLDFQAVHHSQS